MSFYDLPCFVISCEGDTERREITEKRLKEQGLNYQIFKAYDGHHLPIEVFEKENIFHKENHAGARGVALSHKKIWEKMVEENIENAIIFEDDVTFHPHFRYFTEKMWFMTPSDSITFMGYCCFHLSPQGSHYQRESKPCVVEGMPLAIHAYIISKKVAKWFLEHFGRMEENIDLHMRNLYHSLSSQRDWKSYVWWNGDFVDPIQHQLRYNIYFNGFCYQDHNIKLSIHRDRN